jgi:antitoxin HigA-1
MAKKRKPVHPGEILREEFMMPLGLSMNRMAMDLRVPVTRIADIVNERRGITADTALRFARYFKNAPGFWMNLQTRYDLEVATDEIAGKVARDVRPLEAIEAREGRGGAVGFKLVEGKGPGQNHRDAKTAFEGGVGFERIVEICGKSKSCKRLTVHS